MEINRRVTMQSQAFICPMCHDDLQGLLRLVGESKRELWSLQWNWRRSTFIDLGHVPAVDKIACALCDEPFEPLEKILPPCPMRPKNPEC